MTSMKKSVFCVLLLLCFSHISSVHGLECPSCMYLNPSVTGSAGVEAAIGDQYLRVVGEEECYTGDTLNATCTTDGFCFAVMYSSEISFDFQGNGSGVFVYNTTKRGCSNGTLDQCENSVDTSAISGIEQYFQMNFSNVTVSGDSPVFTCCKGDECYSPEPSTVYDDSEEDVASTTEMAATCPRISLVAVSCLVVASYAGVFFFAM